MIGPDPMINIFLISVRFGIVVLVFPSSIIIRFGRSIYPEPFTAAESARRVVPVFFCQTFIVPLRVPFNRCSGLHNS
jgi:hypothetical protein